MWGKGNIEIKLLRSFKFVTNTSLNIHKLMGLVNLAEIDFLICEKIYKGVLNDSIKAYPTGVDKKIGEDFLLLTANNAFDNAVSILHTLICSNKKEEIRIKPLLEAVLNSDKGFEDSIPDEKLIIFIDKIYNNYPNTNSPDFNFLTEDDDRLIGDIMGDLRKKKRLADKLTVLDDLKNKFEEFKFHKIRHQLVAHKNKFLESPSGHANLYLKEEVIKNLGDIVKELKIDTYFWFDYSLDNPLKYTIKSYEDLVLNIKKHEHI